MVTPHERRTRNMGLWDYREGDVVDEKKGKVYNIDHPTRPYFIFLYEKHGNRRLKFNSARAHDVAFVEHVRWVNLKLQDKYYNDYMSPSFDQAVTIGKFASLCKLQCVSPKNPEYKCYHLYEATRTSAPEGNFVRTMYHRHLPDDDPKILNLEFGNRFEAIREDAAYGRRMDVIEFMTERFKHLLRHEHYDSWKDLNVGTTVRVQVNGRDYWFCIERNMHQKKLAVVQFPDFNVHTLSF